MAQAPQDLPEKLLDHLAERWDVPTLAEEFDVPAVTVRKVLGDRKFCDAFMARSVQRFDPQFGKSSGKTAREILEAEGVSSAMRLVELRDSSENERIILNAAVEILDRGAAGRKSEHEHKHLNILTPEQAAAMRNACSESDKLMRTKEILGTT